MNKYLEEGDLSIADIKQGLRIRTISNEIVPMLCGSAFKNKGVQAMLDAVLDYLPSPVDIQAINGRRKMASPANATRVTKSHSRGWHSRLLPIRMWVN